MRDPQSLEEFGASEGQNQFRDQTSSISMVSNSCYQNKRFVLVKTFVCVLVYVLVPASGGRCSDAH